MIVSNDSIKSEYKNVYKETLEKINFPIFQRGYTWKKEQVENILNDIEKLIYEDPKTRATKQLYLLDFVWYYENGFKKYADGQQRVTSLNILILCINEYIAEHKLNLPLLAQFQFTYDDEETQEKYDKFFNEGKRTTAPFGNVYKRMKKFVDDYHIYIEDIVNVIKNNIYVYLKQAANADDAFAIFTQSNSGGKPLSKDDVIKTTIKQYARKYGLSVDGYNFKDIRNLVISYYKLKVGGNFSNLAIMSFLNEEIVKDYKSFKVFCDYLNMVKDINKHSIYNIVSYIEKGQLLNIIYAFAIQGVNVTAKREYIEKVLFPLCLMSIVWKIKKINPGGVALSLFNEILSAINNKKSANDICDMIIKFITDNPDICKISSNDFANGLGYDMDSKVKKALFVMDIVKNNTSGYLNVSSIDLEHIYPQNPCTDWVLNGWTGNAEEQQKIAGSIGNCMLLSQAVNRKIQNKYITNKVVEYNRIIPMDKMLQTPLNTVDFKKLEEDREKYIFQRQRDIAKYIQEDFYFGKVLIVD